MRIIDCEQRSQEWYQARMGIPTASEFSRIITPSGKASSSAVGYMGELIDEIVRPMSERPEDEQMAAFSGNRHTERGNDLEPKARNWYQFVTGAGLTHPGFVLMDDGRAGCSPDSFVFDAEVKGLFFNGIPLVGVMPALDSYLPRGGLEIKCPEGKKHATWMIEGGLPDEHKQQVHGSMVVTGLKRWYFLSYCPGYKPFLVNVEWDDYTTLVAKHLKAFTDELEVRKARIIVDEA